MGYKFWLFILSNKKWAQVHEIEWTDVGIEMKSIGSSVFLMFGFRMKDFHSLSALQRSDTSLSLLPVTRFDVKVINK